MPQAQKTIGFSKLISGVLIWFNQFCLNLIAASLLIKTLDTIQAHFLNNKNKKITLEKK